MSSHHDEIIKNTKHLKFCISRTPIIKKSLDQSIYFFFEETLSKVLETPIKQKFYLAYTLNQDYTFNSQIIFKDKYNITLFLENLYFTYIMFNTLDRNGHSNLFADKDQPKLTQVLLYLVEELSISIKEDDNIKLYLAERPFLIKHFTAVTSAMFMKINAEALSQGELPLDIESMHDGSWINHPFVLSVLYADKSIKLEEIHTKQIIENILAA